MANERDIGAGIAALTLVQSLILALRSAGTLQQPDLERLLEAALAAVEQLEPPDDVAVQSARELVENAQRDLSEHGRNFR